MKIQFESTTACNANCTFCPRSSMTRKGGEMSDELFRKIVKDGKEIRHSFFVPFLNGEPFMFPRIWDWLDYMALEKVRVHIYTNAERVDVDRLVKYDNISVIYCGINAATREVYDKVVRGPDFGVVQAKVSEIIKKAKIFMDNRDEVWDREELKRAIQDIIADCGKFVCLLGGKSTGKSLVLEYLEKRNMGTVFIVDLRVRDKDILKALLTVLETRRDYYVNLDNQTPTIEAVLKAGEVFASVVGKGAAYGQFLTTVTAFMKMNSAKKTLEVLIDGLIKVEGEKVTIIIDEANVAFTIKPETKEEKIDAASDALLCLHNSQNKPERFELFLNIFRM